MKSRGIGSGLLVHTTGDIEGFRVVATPQDQRNSSYSSRQLKVTKVVMKVEMWFIVNNHTAFEFHR